jgi:predicted enzyme related to lactoylglutathione lyase
MQFTGLMVYVQDMSRAVAFYRDVLQLPLEMESPGWSQFALGNGLWLGLHPSREPAEPSRGWLPGFEVSDIQDTKQRVQASGSEITGDYHDIPGGVVIEFADPDGNKLNASQMGISCADLGVASA